MMRKGGIRTLTRNVYRTWLGGLLTSLLLTCILLYSWGRTSLPHLYQRSRQHATTLPHSTSPQRQAAESRADNSVVSQSTEPVGGREISVQLPFVKERLRFLHIDPASRNSAINDRPVPDPHPSPSHHGQEVRHSTLPSARGHGAGVGTGAKENHGESGFGRDENGFLKVPRKALHEVPVHRAGFPNVSDIDVRLLLPRRSVSGVGEEACSSHHHLVFVKVHKAASSTLANIIQRYGFTRDLNFVLPNRAPKSMAYNYITKSGEVFSQDFILPAPAGGHYDLLWNHAIYNRTTFNTFMPRDTVYISILREPFQQFVSAYAFYNSPYIGRFISMRVNPFSHYLHYMPHPHLLDYFRNKQSEDLGMTGKHVLNSTLRHQYLQQLNKELQLVLITEFFDESLVLLRRLMCWSIKDILYISKNKNSYKPIFVFNSQDYARHRELAAADYELYQFFKHKFLRTLAAQGVDFEHEVTHFRDVLRGVQRFCEQAQAQLPKQFFVPRSPWSVEFVVTRQDCQLLVMPELAFLDKLVEINIAKLKLPRTAADQKSHPVRSPASNNHSLPLPH